MAKNLKAMISNIKKRMSFRRGSTTNENSGNTISHKLIGLNTLLVSQCVAYLKQPISLREEGLFRVPGDCNQINMYLKQFDYSLKPNLDEELDPNNVSCLLKIHIRINGGLLPKKEAGEMYAAVRQKNIEEISSVIKTISAQQQSILKEVLFLFKEVSEHQDENKMCSGAIATSCGLSIFPVVNAGNANLMLKVLIDNVEEIFQQ